MLSRISLITIILVCYDLHKGHAVTWPTDTLEIEISEDTRKENLHKFMANEDPSGYEILSQNVSNRFSIGPDGTLSSAAKLDYESTEKAYLIVIMAFNNTGTVRHANLTCVIIVTDVNDEQPKFEEQSYSVNIPNDVQNNTNVLNVSAIDADVTAAFKIVVYSIKDGGDKADFTIDTNTGFIKAASNLTGPHTFMITVVATDNNSSIFTDEASVSMCINGCTPSGSSALEKSTFAFLAALVFGAVLM